MAQGFSGRLLLLAVETGTEGSGTYVSLGGLRDATITVNQSTVDTTSKESAGVRQLLDAQVLRSVSISGSGVFLNSAELKFVRDAAIAGDQKNFRMTTAGTATAGVTYTGQFAITSFEETGAHDGEQQYSLTLESTGTVTMAALP